MSTDGEKQPLVESRPRSRLKLRCTIVLFMSLLSYLGLYLCDYPRNEWLQNKVQREIFPNQTFSFSKVCGEINRSDPNFGKHASVQEVTAKWNMYSHTTNKGVARFTAFLYTAYTDCYGRRFLFILGSISIFIYNGLTALIIYFDAHPIYLVGTGLLYGLTGTSYGFLAATYAFMADLTRTGKERSAALFLAAASTSTGGAIGIFTVGFYIQSRGFFYPALTAASLQMLLVLLSIFAISESLPAERRIIRPSFISVIKRPFTFYTSADFKHVRYGFILLLLSFAFADMTVTHRKTIETLYQLGLPFCWEPTQIALFATVICAGETLFGLGAMKILQSFIKDITIALISTTTNAGSLVLEGLARNSLSMYLATIPTVLNNLAAPLIRSSMSAMTSEKQQGALFASISLVQSLCSLLAGITDNSVYAATLEVFNGFIFIVLAGVCGVTIALISIFICISKGKKEIHYLIQEKKLSVGQG